MKCKKIIMSALLLTSIISASAGCGSLQLKEKLNEKAVESSSLSTSVTTLVTNNKIVTEPTKIEATEPEVLKGKKSTKDKPLKIGEVGLCGKYESSNNTYQTVNVRANKIIRGDKAKSIVEKYNKENKFVQINELSSASVEYAIIEYDVSLTENYASSGDITAVLEMNVKGKDGDDLQYKDVIYTLTSSDISNPDSIKKGEIQSLKSVFAIPIGCTDYECVFGDSEGKEFAYFKGE